MSPAELLARNALRFPERRFLLTADGSLTFAQARDAVAKIAGGLVRRGVHKGDVVAILMHNSLENVLCALAASWIGATPAPVNTGLIGDGLAHPLRLTRTRIVIADDMLVPNLLSVIGQTPEVRRVLVKGELPEYRAAGLEIESLAHLDRAEGASPQVQVDELDPGMILFTSGTTGPSKACVLSNRYLLRQAELHVKYLELRENDVLYSPFPLYHIDAATLTVLAAATIGATAALGVRFSASRFWQEVRDFGATVFNFMGATLTILWKQAPSPLDAQHKVRMAWGVPMPEWSQGWKDRFGFELRELYGLTDAGVVAYDRVSAGHRDGSCGQVVDEFEVAIADARGSLVKDDEVGEIVIRSREPGTIMTEYLGMPQETLQAFRGLWFHTGDLGHLDADGYLYFHGRSKESIRRRGENISAFEVEQAISAHPAVLEVAAVGVPSELGEEDLAVFVVTRPDVKLDAPELVADCRRRLAEFMVPRYVSFIDEMPKTPTQKVEKYRLREMGIGPSTWDREAVADKMEARSAR